MRKLLALSIVCLAVLGGGVATDTANALRQRCTGIHQGINFYRNATHEWQNKLGHPITKSSKRPILGCRYAAWVAKLWQVRARDWRIRYEKYQAEVRAWQRSMSNPEAAIRHVFGGYADQAISVARCESGLSVWASNGQYLGMFQMGESERATYGHGSTPLAQAQAAYRYFTASGRDWSPWQCSPWGMNW